MDISPRYQESWSDEGDTTVYVWNRDIGDHTYIFIAIANPGRLHVTVSRETRTYDRTHVVAFRKDERETANAGSA